MGFLRKAWNFITGKGFKEDIEQVKDTKVSELERAENLQVQKPIMDELPKREPTRKTKKQPLTQPTEVEKISKIYKSKGKLSDMEEKLRKGEVTQIAFQPTTNVNELNNVYKGLFRKSAISVIDKYGNEDNTLMDILIQNRSKLQHRFTAEIMIVTNKNVGSMSIDGILAEHLGNIDDFIKVGMTYTSEELKVAMNNAMTFYEKQYGSIGGNIVAPMETKSTIRDIQIRVTFA